MRICPLCHEPMAGESHAAIYHRACYRERERILDRLRARARRHGTDVERLCCICLGPREKGKRMCAPCRVRRERETNARYSSSEKGHTKFIRYNNSPRRKIAQSEWADRNKELRRASQRKYAAKHARSGTVLPCQTLLCRGTFVRNPTNARRKFCDECRVIHRTITRHEAMSIHAIRRERLRRAA